MPFLWALLTISLLVTSGCGNREYRVPWATPTTEPFVVLPCGEEFRRIQALWQLRVDGDRFLSSIADIDPEEIRRLGGVNPVVCSKRTTSSEQVNIVSLPPEPTDAPVNNSYEKAESQKDSVYRVSVTHTDVIVDARCVYRGGSNTKTAVEVTVRNVLPGPLTVMSIYVRGLSANRDRIFDTTSLHFTNLEPDQTATDTGSLFDTKPGTICEVTDFKCFWEPPPNYWLVNCSLTSRG